MFKYLCTLCLLCFTVSTFAQSESTATAGQDIKIDVLAVYEEVVQEGYASAQIYRKLANGRFLENNFQEANKWYGLLFESTTDLEAIDYFQYGKTLEALNQSIKARKYLAQYAEVTKDQN